MTCVLCRNIISWINRHIRFTEWNSQDWLNLRLTDWLEEWTDCEEKAKELSNFLFERGVSPLATSLDNLIFRFTSAQSAPFLTCIYPTIEEEEDEKPKSICKVLYERYKSLKFVKHISFRGRGDLTCFSVTLKSGYVKHITVHRQQRNGLHSCRKRNFPGGTEHEECRGPKSKKSDGRV